MNCKGNATIPPPEALTMKSILFFLGGGGGGEVTVEPVCINLTLMTKQ